MRHQVNRPFVAQAKYPINDFVLNVFDGTCICPFVDQCFNFLFSNRILRRSYVEYPDNSFGRYAKEPYKRSHNFAQDVHWKSDDGRVFLRNSQSDALWYQFTQYERKKRNDNHHDKYRELSTVSVQPTY